LLPFFSSQRFPGVADIREEVIDLLLKSRRKDFALATVAKQMSVVKPRLEQRDRSSRGYRVAKKFDVVSHIVGGEKFAD
jgi:hypothetical protein